MTVAHKDLTGTDLHEIKGASTATSGQVPVANGSGGAPFGKLTHTSLQTTGNPFGAQLFHVREEQPNNTVSSTSSASGWVTCVLNTTKTNEITSASLSANQISLPAGTYYANFSLPSVLTGTAGNIWKLRLRNITAGSSLIISPTYSWTGSATGGTWHMETSGRFTLAGTTTLEVQFYNNSGQAPGGTRSTAYSEIEVYTDLQIWKLA